MNIAKVKKSIERAEHALHAMVSALADARLQEAAAEFKKKFPAWAQSPAWSLHIMFGNGIEAGIIEFDDTGPRSLSLQDGKMVIGHSNTPYDNCGVVCRDLQFLAKALIDVIDITDGYTKGCPEDLIIRS